MQRFKPFSQQPRRTSAVQQALFVVQQASFAVQQFWGLLCGLSESDLASANRRPRTRNEPRNSRVNMMILQKSLWVEIRVRCERIVRSDEAQEPDDDGANDFAVQATDGLTAPNALENMETWIGRERGDRRCALGAGCGNEREKLAHQRERHVEIERLAPKKVFAKCRRFAIPPPPERGRRRLRPLRRESHSDDSRRDNLRRNFEPSRPTGRWARRLLRRRHRRRSSPRRSMSFSLFRFGGRSLQILRQVDGVECDRRARGGDLLARGPEDGVRQEAAVTFLGQTHM